MYRISGLWAILVQNSLGVFLLEPLELGPFPLTNKPGIDTRIVLHLAKEVHIRLIHLTDDRCAK